jgi:hypothetical protein
VTNRITRYYDDLEVLLDGKATPTAPEQPISLWIGRDVLAAVVEENLANIRRNRTRDLESDDERGRNDAIEGERLRVLDWIRSRHAAHLFGTVTLIDSVNEQAELEAGEQDRGNDGDSPSEDMG